MKSTNSKTHRLLRNAAIACACICFPAALQANPSFFDLNAGEKASVATENETIAQGSEADTYKYVADMGKKQKQQPKKRRRHRKITHVR